MARRRILVVIADSFSVAQIEAVAERREPTIDFLEFAAAVGGDVLSYDSLRRRESAGPKHYPYVDVPHPALDPQPAKLKRNIRLLWQLSTAAYDLAKDYDLVLLTGEDLGIPYAHKCSRTGRRAKVMVIAHYLNPLKKSLLLKHGRLGQYLDKLVTYSPVQHLFATERLRFPAEAVELIPFHADHRFYCPAQVEREPGLIVAAGMERRDYATLFEAVRGTNLRLELGAGSPWSRFRRVMPPLPPNANNRFRSREELRDLHRRCGTLVAPLFDTEFQAGISVILESMACGAPVVVSQTLGLSHLLRDGAEGIYFTPGDSAGLRRVLLKLAENPSLAAAIGQAGRRKIENFMTTRHFVARLEQIAASALSPVPQREFYIIPSLHLVGGQEATA